MISVSRGPEPAIITRNKQAWLTAWRAAPTRAAKKKALEKYRQAAIRNALRERFHSKCAYCESATEASSWGHIEHFRPRKHFPARSFDWDNLLWACHRCNSECKGDQFPRSRDGGPLVDPSHEPPSDHLIFDYDPIARLAIIYGRTVRGTTTVDVLRLNRKELLKLRSRWVSHLEAVAVLAQRGNQDARRLLDEAKQDDSPYAAFARQFQ